MLQIVSPKEKLVRAIAGFQPQDKRDIPEAKEIIGERKWNKNL